MGGLEIAVSIAGFAVIAAIGVFIVAWLVPARNSRLMRCPETGAVTYVDTTTTARGEDAAEVTVRWCELWPQRKDCARTCLARYPQASPGYRIDVKALRPFDRQ